MTDRDGVIKALEEAIPFVDGRGYGDVAATMHDALELLKEQEPVMRSSRRGTNGISLVWTCGKCGADLEPNNRKARYCSFCGQAVKWDG